jgi:hypothetical protein
LGFSHGRSTIILGLAQASFVLIVIAAKNLNDNYLLLGILALCTLLSFLLDRAIQNKVPKENL